MSPKEFEQNQHVRSHVSKSQVQLGLHSLQYSPPAFSPQCCKASASQHNNPAGLCTVRQLGVKSLCLLLHL